MRYATVLSLAFVFCAYSFVWTQQVDEQTVSGKPTSIRDFFPLGTIAAYYRDRETESYCFWLATAEQQRQVRADLLENRKENGAELREVPNPIVEGGKLIEITQQGSDFVGFRTINSNRSRELIIPLDRISRIQRRLQNE